jgi:DNA end-binding protein Ku
MELLRGPKLAREITMASTVWRGRLVFGLVSVPVRLVKAARRERIRFHNVYRPSVAPEPADEEPEEVEPPPKRGSQATIHELPRRETAETPVPPPIARVRNMPVAEDNQAPVEKSEVLKGYEIEKGRYVTFQPHEIAAARPKTSTELTMTEFVRLDEIDPIFFETSYYAMPDRGGEKPYALLFKALAESGYAALGSIAMHGREHATVIRSGRHGLILHSLFYQNEVRADEEYRSDASLVSAKELELAKTFVTTFAAPFDASKLKDTLEEQLRKLIDARADTAIDAYEHGEVTPRAPVVDIMEALRKSLEIARKPPASAERPPTGDRKLPSRRRRP